MKKTFKQFDIDELDATHTSVSLPAKELVWKSLAGIELNSVGAMSNAQVDGNSAGKLLRALLGHLSFMELIIHVGEGVDWKWIRWSDIDDLTCWWVAEGYPDFVVVDITSMEGYSVQEEEYEYAAYRVKISV